MLKYFLIATAVAVTFIATPADAVEPDENSAVSKNFKSFGRDLRSLRKISDQDELVAFLEKAHSAVTANRSEVPSFMEAGTDQYAEYQDGIDEFLTKIDSALALAKAGDVDGAKEIASNFRKVKDKYHEHFDIED